MKKIKIFIQNNIKFVTILTCVLSVAFILGIMMFAPYKTPEVTAAELSNQSETYQNYLDGSITVYKTKARMIGEWSFYERTNLKALVVENADYIEDNAFWGCSNLHNLVLNKNELIELKWGNVKIPLGTFRNTQFQEKKGNIFVPDNLYETYRQDPHWKHYSLQLRKMSEITFSVSAINNNDYIVDEIIDKSIKEAEIYGVDNLCGYTFYNCQELKTVKIYGNVKLIPRYYFANCTNLKKLELFCGPLSYTQYCFKGSGLEYLE